MRTQKDIKRYIEDNDQAFATVLNKRCQITFGTHTGESVVLDVLKAKADSINTPPDKIPERTSTGDVKYYTPGMLNIHCDDIDLCFVIDHIQRIVITTAGICIQMINDDTICLTIIGD